MSDLDRWFEHARKTNDVTTPVGRTQWPKVEERLRKVLDTFCDVRGFMPSSPFERKQLVAGARDFVDSVGERPDLLREAMLYLQPRQIVVASPRSCISYCRDKLLRSQDKQLDKMQKSDFFD